jgi:glycosyltransferase involved in cell wall biosynthesis
MKIGIFGKFPPIEGGVSMRTFWAAHGLAKLGHTVHVATNAKEVGPAFRMYMREQDWAQCEAQYGAGSVKVHWTDGYPGRQWHIPQGVPYVTKLASIGLELAQSGEIDIIYSYYAEPYCVAGHIVAQATGLPHVVRTAGSDAGRLWSLPQFAACYGHVFKSAAAVLCGPTVAAKMIAAGVAPSRLAFDPEPVRLQELFTPEGPELDVDLLQQQVLSDPDAHCRGSLFGTFDPSLKYIGIYGKLGKSKGTYSLLEAFKRLNAAGVRAGLLVMARERSDGAFRERLQADGLEAVVCQLPFLPHWRVPEFIRSCVAVCCLEQDFPISFHTPAVAREVITCGGCLIGSKEILQKLPAVRELMSAQGCIAVLDVHRADDLAGKLAWVLDHPDEVANMRLEARRHGVAIEAGSNFPARLESILRDVLQTGHLSPENIRKLPGCDHAGRADEVVAPAGAAVPAA